MEISVRELCAVESSEDLLITLISLIGLHNLLFDKSSSRLTAVLDFEFAHIGAPVSEWLFSFFDLDGILPAAVSPMGPIRDWMLHEFPQGGVISSDDKKTSKPLNRKLTTAETFAVAWDTALAEAGVNKPSMISGAGETADIWWFSQEICQAYWFFDSFLAKKTPVQLSRMKTSSEQFLEASLAQWGF